MGHRRGHRPLRPRRDLRGSGGGAAAGEGAVRPRQAALQGRLHLGGSPVQTRGTDGVHSIEFEEGCFGCIKLVLKI